MTASEQFPIFLARCPHCTHLLVDETSAWCDECKDWIDGDEVGTVTVEWCDDGSIAVRGGGYAPREEL